jgi:alkylation response protein AidB-like acyl-CoA dehydrogenase
VRERYLPRLTTTSYEDQWDGAMFMTERSGGSDLSETETAATKDGEHWLLEGEKWFCSNVDAKAILTLARPEGAGPGTKGLALFLVPSLLEDGTPNGIHIRRIKDKLGTRSVPTGEITFERAIAYQVGEAGIGLVRMMEMVNASRLGVAVMGAGIARRTALEAALHASQRRAFGRLIIDYPMVRETLIDMQIEAEAVLHLCLESAALGAKVAAGKAEEGDQEFLRILTPLTKIRAARVGLDNAVQAVEVLGGNGYIEDWPTARQLRDAQCHTIWEGTENINSLDVLRAMTKTNAHAALLERVDRVIEDASGENSELLAKSKEEAAETAKIVSDAPEIHAKRFAHMLANLISAAQLIAHSVEAKTERSQLVASRYLERRIRRSNGLPHVDAYLADEAFHLIVPVPGS